VGKESRWLRNNKIDQCIIDYNEDIKTKQVKPLE